jgi:elongator complex protein 3
MGGTFTSRIPEYQKWFVKRCFDALNKQISNNINEAKLKNEIAQQRCIGLTIETRPDWFRLKHADNMLNLGATRVELGVQSTFDSILKNIDRGHTVSDSIFATKIAKKAGFKLCYHLMPGLPGSDMKKDLETIKDIFENPDFKPDMIKIYPTLVIEGTKLYNLWKSGDYKPLNSHSAANLISSMKKLIPEWARIQRIQRDVPAQFICSGVLKSNLRQIILKDMQEHGKECRCIRCREVGHKSLENQIDIESLDLLISRINYEASDNLEIFLSLEDKVQDVIVGYLRLRDIDYSHRYELNKNPCMIIRELKILGKELSLGQNSKFALQHKGLGQEILVEAERICVEEFNKKSLFVLSGIGVKEYYRKQGYRNNGVYLEKKLN